MNRSQQRQFVMDVCNGITEHIHARINDGRVPEDWDGFYLRRLVADVAREEFADWRYTRAESRRYNAQRAGSNI